MKRTFAILATALAMTNARAEDHVGVNIGKVINANPPGWVRISFSFKNDATPLRFVVIECALLGPGPDKEVIGTQPTWLANIGPNATVDGSVMINAHGFKWESATCRVGNSH